MKKRTQPLPQRKKFADALLSGKAATMTDAARIAKYKNPHNAANRLMKAEDVRNYMMAKFEEAGITSDAIALKMAEGLEALSPPKKDGGKRYEDFFTRRLYLDMYFRLRGLYAPERSEHIERRIVINITPDFLKGLQDAGALSKEEIGYIEGEVIEANQG